MIAALEAFQGRFSLTFDYDIVDIDQYPVQEAKWGDKVPVLLLDDLEVCHYFLDEAALKKCLTQATNSSTGGDQRPI